MLFPKNKLQGRTQLLGEGLQRIQPSTGRSDIATLASVKRLTSSFNEIECDYRAIQYAKLESSTQEIDMLLSTLGKNKVSEQHYVQPSALWRLPALILCS